ncbi:MAG: ABC transporter substrate-binding protein [Alphaproteobacteria bacterium]|nr:ABC transporter substrate-binding protein [Alphaproteobacteria bacterium]
MNKKLVLETTAPFQGLAELVAYDEGLFEEEGLTIEWADREKGVDKSPQLDITDHKDAPRYASHGKMMEQGKADLYNACEWGNYSRVETTNVGSRQIGRRSIVTYAALVVRDDSPVQTPQQFANRQIGVPMFSGTHYLTLQMLEGFVPRDLIKLGRVPNGSNYRYKLLMDGTVDATTLTEPYITLAEKTGCRTVIGCFHHGTEVASDRVDAETYSAFNRAVRKAVRRINADKWAYMHYFIDYYKELDPEGMAKLEVRDLNPARLLLVDPHPIPEDELQRTFDWMKSWDFLETMECGAGTELINEEVQQKGYQRAPDEDKLESEILKGV